MGHDDLEGEPWRNVFIVHSSKDEKTAEKLLELLEKQGIDCFLSGQSIRGGENWAKRLNDELDKASSVVVVVSSNTLAASYAEDEVRISRSKNKNIVPILVEKTPTTGWLDYHLGGRQFINAYDGGIQRNLAAIILALDPGADPPPVPVLAWYRNSKSVVPIVVLVVAGLVALFAIKDWWPLSPDQEPDDDTTDDEPISEPTPPEMFTLSLTRVSASETTALACPARPWSISVEVCKGEDPGCIDRNAPRSRWARGRPSADHPPSDAETRCDQARLVCWDRR